MIKKVIIFLFIFFILSNKLNLFAQQFKTLPIKTLPPNVKIIKTKIPKRTPKIIIVKRKKIIVKPKITQKLTKKVTPKPTKTPEKTKIIKNTTTPANIKAIKTINIKMPIVEKNKKNNKDGEKNIKNIDLLNTINYNINNFFILLCLLATYIVSSIILKKILK